MTLSDPVSIISRRRFQAVGTVAVGPDPKAEAVLDKPAPARHFCRRTRLR